MNNKHSHIVAAKDAWVVFSGQTDLPWLKCLKPGFRHCYVLLNDGYHWVSIDPLFPYTEIIVHHVSPAFDLPKWLEGRGHRTVYCPVARPLKKTASVSVFTCVEAVKRIIGLHNWRVHTPWQLYKYLTRKISPQQTKESLNGIFNIRPESPRTAASRLCSSVAVTKTDRHNAPVETGRRG